jgi:hypothetical protein
MLRWFKRRSADCRCEPRWPGLVTEQYGYEMPCLPSEHGSVWTIYHKLRARCTACGAQYPGNFVIEPGTPPPFDFARKGDWDEW